MMKATCETCGWVVTATSEAYLDIRILAHEYIYPDHVVKEDHGTE